jgi:hypothetical protein
MAIVDLLNQYESHQIYWYRNAGLGFRYIVEKYEEKSIFIFSNINYKIDNENNRLNFQVPVEDFPNIHPDSIQLNFSPEYFYDYQIQFVTLNQNLIFENFILDNLKYFNDFTQDELRTEFYNQFEIITEEEKESIEIVGNILDLNLERKISVLKPLVISKYQDLPMAVKIDYLNYKVLFIKSTNQLIYDFLRVNEINVFQVLG